MGSLDFGKLTTIVLVFFVITFFFGGEIMYWFDHKDDLRFSMKEVVYSKEQFNNLDEIEQKSIRDDISALCIRKKHKDDLTCQETAYWLGDALEDEGVSHGLAVEWMEICVTSCKSAKKPITTLDDRPGKRTGI